MTKADTSAVLSRAFDSLARYEDSEQAKVRLIASAPAMLEALKALRASLDATDAQQKTAAQMFACDAADAAIAQATGQEAE